MRRAKVIELPIKTTVDAAVADPSVTAMLSDGYTVAYLWVTEILDDTDQVMGQKVNMLFVPMADMQPVVEAVQHLGQLQHRLENAVYALCAAVAVPGVLLAIAVAVR